MLKRIFDITISASLLLLLTPLLGIIGILIKITSKGPCIFWTKRIGINNQIFLMPKFRSMFVDTPEVATHLLKNSNAYITSVGGFLRTTSLDELPQLWSILTGDMSFVGPRPALYNQDDLIKMRTDAGVHTLTPGLTGWAQVNGRDEIPLEKKVSFDQEYRDKKSFWFDLQILFITFKNVIYKKNISH